MTQTDIPHLRPTKTSSQLILKGQPFFMLPAELHNSSFSSREHMTHIWGKLKAMNFNTVIAAVTWEMLEPEQGRFDFTTLDQGIEDARKHCMQLVLLWFGSYKNGTSSHVPAWVKKDIKRFPRCFVTDEDRRLKMVEVLSPFNPASWEADAKAFAAMMSHVREIDGIANTVLMAQVENECGLLGDSRDRSAVALEAWNRPVPADFLTHLRRDSSRHPLFTKRWPDFNERIQGTDDLSWEDLFGLGVPADEMFMAYGYANYLGKVAEAGKKEYPIPLYSNVWLNVEAPEYLDVADVPKETGLPALVGGGTKAGTYPSGGPCAHTLDVWNYFASSLDFISPDLYLQDYPWSCEQYRYKNQPLFIPEQRHDARGARRSFLAYGTHAAIGAAPFGIDSVDLCDSAYTTPYKVLGSASKYILEAQGERPDEMFGFFFDEWNEESSRQGALKWTKVIAGYEVTVTRSFVFGKPGPGYGMVIHQGNSRFLLIGCGFQVTFQSTDPNSVFTGIEEFYEKKVADDGSLVNLRNLNGDERLGGGLAIMPSENPDYGGFPIRVSGGIKTYITEVAAYHV
ncbi:glycoside hydrolase superfamily [Dactylonectria estremocensis]|uniref:Glycoside hydrolase superfamily n=1 Tax=Dactylonectria estremocensis TaxID=1079267 RepID=A0A9P9E4S9_9HYPO|nr:glycoside hydrolase superfamily [Dactylonectria estremocensis]